MSTKPKLTDAQRDALKALREHGGTGVMQRNGTVLAAGVTLSGDYDSDGNGIKGDHFSRLTWYALIDAGLCARSGARINVTAAGKEFPL